MAGVVRHPRGGGTVASGRVISGGGHCRGWTPGRTRSVGAPGHRVDPWAAWEAQGLALAQPFFSRGTSWGFTHCVCAGAIGANCVPARGQTARLALVSPPVRRL